MERGHSVIPHVRFWLDLFREFGAATESSIRFLHFDPTPSLSFESELYDTIILYRAGGRKRHIDSSLFSLRGQHNAGGHPADPQQQYANCVSELWRSVRHRLYDLSGGFWTLHGINMLETVTTVTTVTTVLTTTEGKSSHRWVLPNSVSGAQQHSVVLSVRERVCYTVGLGPVVAALT
jgi:hypothetical protein